METMTIFRATLKLIKEGKFNILSMAEIGYHARVSATTVETIYESREELIRALGESIFRDLTGIITLHLNTKATFEEKFHLLWEGLTEYYQNHPDIISFLDHFKSFPFNVTYVEKLEEESIQVLATFFSHHTSPGSAIGAETTARLFHENTKIAARLSNSENREEMKAVAGLILAGLNHTILHKRRTMEAA